MGKLQESSLPALNVARLNHSSMALGDQAYVACGLSRRMPLSSMETLRRGAQAWELIDIPNLSPRWFPVLCQIDFNKICILGGGNHERYSDGVVLNAKTCNVVRQISPDSEWGFDCASESFMTTEGEIVALVRSSFDVHLVWSHTTRRRTKST